MIAVALCSGMTSAHDTCVVVEDTRDDVVRVFDETGLVWDWQSDQAEYPCTPLESTYPTSVSTETVAVTDEETGITVDEHGLIREPDGTPSSWSASAVAAGADALTARAVTIDSMTTGSSYLETYYPGEVIEIFGSADRYYLSDGSSWSSGAGSYRRVTVRLDRTEVSGDTVRFILHPPADGVLYEQTDYNAGDYSAQGKLGIVSPLVIEATIGSNTAVMRGVAEILSNDATWYGEPRFNYYSSLVGSHVPFEVTYTIAGEAWNAGSFDRVFRYRYAGSVDFADPVWVPAVVSLEILGSAQVPDGSSVPFVAVAGFENGTQRDVTGDASWEVEPDTIASIENGILTTQQIQSAEETLTIRAHYVQGELTVDAEKTIRCLQGGSAELPSAWEMYQGDPRHTGLASIPVEPDVFTLRWQRDIGSGRALNPVTAADGKVFVSLMSYFHQGPSLFVLDDRDGEVLWSRDFGDPFSVNPPSYAFGNVYIQTGDHGSNTFLHAFDAESGQRVFQSPHSAQWERYYAPTIYQGSVYVNGGYYGGMYAFDAFSGQQLWFRPLSQYDEWTPAVDDDYAYAYVGGLLSVVDRISGEVSHTIVDPNFDWHGWSMDLAPVLGGAGDIVVIHGGRLVSFDLQTRSIRYELTGTFRGQPTVAAGVVYAVNASGIVAVDQETGNQLWAWNSAGAQLRSNLVVTDTHLFVASTDDLFAVELLSHDDVWTYPVGGHLSLSDEILYVASSNGLLTAINMPEYTPALLERIEVSGPATVVEFSEAQYTATAYYDDGRVRDRTELTDWSVEPASYAAFDEFGLLTVGELLEPTVAVVVRGLYTEGDVTRSAAIPVELRIGVSIEEFIRRNVSAALEIKRQLIADLEMALLRERAAQAVAEEWIAGELGENPPQCDPWRCLSHLDLGISLEEESLARMKGSIGALLEFLRAISTGGPIFSELPREGNGLSVGPTRAVGAADR
jgi:outer membrane protein assembly factor BamB